MTRNSLRLISECQIFVALLACLWASAARPQKTNSVTAVDLLGTITVNQAANGLGFNLDPEQDWQWAAAAAAGATHARIQCSWEQVEQQTAPPFNAPSTPQYVQTPSCLSGLTSAKKYGIHPTITAAYGTPHHQILNVTVPSGAPAGATTLRIVFASGVGGSTFAHLAVPYDYFGLLPYGRDSAVGPYYGTFISAVSVTDPTHATITLGSALTSALPAGDSTYGIIEVLYPSAATASGSDPSVVAYGNYVNFLAQSMAAAGVTGDVELWNEPPSAALDPWDNRWSNYDSNLLPTMPATALTSAQTPNFGFVANLQSRTLPSGVTATWNGTSGDGSASVLGAQMFANSGIKASQPMASVTRESFHPYGGPYGNPEDVMWSQPCLLAAVAANTNFATCALSGERQGPNNIYEAYLDAVAKSSNPAWGVGRAITETNMLPPAAGLQVQQARFDLRQYIGFQALGYTPIEFYKLYDGGTRGDPNFSFVEQVGSTTTFESKPNYTAIAGLMADLKPVSNLPVAPYTPDKLGKIVSYTGTYPLATVHMVGSRGGAAANSEMFFIWQRSTTPCSGSVCSGNWMTLSSPSPGPVSISVPAGTRVSSVTNLTSRAAVSYITAGQVVSFLVSDDPLEILIDPVAAVSISVPNTTVAYTGQPVAVTPTTVPAGVSSTTTYNGSTTAPTTAGTYTVVATTTDPNYAPMSATGELNITPVTSPLTWTPSSSTVLAGQAIGSSILDAVSTLPGAVIYTATPSSGQSSFEVTPASQLERGNYVISAIFMPTDATDYTSTSMDISLSAVAGSVWITNLTGGVSVLSSSGMTVAEAAAGGTGIAIDNAADMWSLNKNANSISKFSSSGVVIGSGYTGGGMSAPTQLAIDGANIVWIANSNSTVTKMSSSGTPVSSSNGYSTTTSSPSSLSIDASGNLWITNAGDDSLTEMVGVAAPVRTPATMAAMINMPGTKP